MRLDLLGLGADVKTRHSSRSAGGSKDAAEHPDRGGFAGTVGAKETEDLPLGHFKADPIDRDEAAKSPFQIFDHDCFIVYFVIHD